jgi:hypothetical protein
LDQYLACIFKRDWITGKGFIKMTTAHTTSNGRLITASNFVARYPLLSFFGLAILISWLLAVPSLFFGVPFKPFQTAGAYGPLLSAVVISFAMGGSELKELFRRMTNFRFGLVWYLLALFFYVFLYLLIAGLSGAPLVKSLSEKWSFIFTLYLPALFTTYLINPIGEETGWTGFALPRLQMHRIRTGTQTITVTVPGKPTLAGIDPYHLLDWEAPGEDNNIVEVKIEG